MRRIIVLFICFKCIISYGQLPLNDDGEIEYTDVIIQDSTTSEVLYLRAKKTITEIFKSSKNVIQNDDPVTKHIIAKGSIESDYNWGMGSCDGLIQFSMIIQCKDNRYKYSIKPLGHECLPGCKFDCSGGNLSNEKPDCGTFNMPIKYWNKIKETADMNFRSIVSIIKKSMSKKDNNDW